MKTLWVGLVIALLVGVSVPAAAHIAEVETSVSMPAPASEDDLRDALNAAARDVIAEFQPVVLAITAAYVNAGRLYVHFLVADEAGARLLGVWEPDADDPDRPAEPRERGGHRLRI